MQVCNRWPLYNRPRVDKTWEELWADGIEPGELFDGKGPLPELVQQLKEGALPRGARALVPGCGRGYDVEALCESGLYDTTIGMDLSASAVAIAKSYLTPKKLSGDYSVVEGDFFDGDNEILSKPFDVVYDHSFFCAIPVGWRAKWAARMRDVVRVGGVLVTVIWPVGDKEVKFPTDPRALTNPKGSGGPPHGAAEQDYAELLEGDGGFKKKDSRMPPNDRVHEGRGDGMTYWCVWERV